MSLRNSTRLNSKETLTYPSDPPTGEDFLYTDGFRTPERSTSIRPIYNYVNSSPVRGRSSDMASFSPTNSERSVVDDVLASRRQKSIRGPIFGDSFGSQRMESREARRRLAAQKQAETRSELRQKKLLALRGGEDETERFVMNSELSEELEQLQMEAQKNSIPSELWEDYELEHRKEMELEDEELVQFLENRDVWERELEQLLSDFSVT